MQSSVVANFTTLLKWFRCLALIWFNWPVKTVQCSRTLNGVNSSTLTIVYCLEIISWSIQLGQGGTNFWGPFLKSKRKDTLEARQPCRSLAVTGARDSCFSPWCSCQSWKPHFLQTPFSIQKEGCFLASYICKSGSILACRWVMLLSRRKDWTISKILGESPCPLRKKVASCLHRIMYFLLSLSFFLSSALPWFSKLQ